MLIRSAHISKRLINIQSSLVSLQYLLQTSSFHASTAVKTHSPAKVAVAEQQPPPGSYEYLVREAIWNDNKRNNSNGSLFPAGKKDSGAESKCNALRDPSHSGPVLTQSARRPERTSRESIEHGAQSQVSRAKAVRQEVGEISSHETAPLISPKLIYKAYRVETDYGKGRAQADLTDEDLGASPIKGAKYVIFPADGDPVATSYTNTTETTIPVSRDQEQRYKYWKDFLTETLERNPTQVFKSLEDALYPPSVAGPELALPWDFSRRAKRESDQDLNWYILKRRLDHVMAYYLRDSEVPSDENIRTLHRMLCRLIEIASLGKEHGAQISQRAIWWMLDHCNDFQTDALFAAMRTQKIDFHPLTIRKFLERYIGMGDVDTSSMLLQAYVTSGIDKSSRGVLEICTRFLRAPFHVENLSRTRSEILARILEMGIRPDTMLLNNILISAIEGRDFEVARETYRLAKENGLHHDAFTYSIMLKCGTLSLDLDIIKTIVADAEVDGTLLNNEHVATALLHALYTVAYSRPQRQVFDALLPVYMEYWDTSPLEKLGLISEDAGAVPKSGNPKALPGPPALAFMIFSHIRQYYRDIDVEYLFERYRQLVEDENPLFAALAENTFVPNAFLYALGRYAPTLPSCTNVIKHMIELSRPSSRRGKVAPPDVITWTILLGSYIRHGQKNAAEKVFAMMQDRGTKPDIVSWQILVKGYARQQDIDGALDARRRMEEDGFVAGDELMLGLAKIKDRKGLLRLLERQQHFRDRNVASEGEEAVDW